MPMPCTRIFLWYDLAPFLMRKHPLCGLTLLRGIAVLASLVFLSHTVLGATFTVTTTSDSGAGSLRQAILDATNGTDTIEFQIPGSPPFTIMPTLALPRLTSPVIINATTQPGYVDHPVVVLDGSLTAVGVVGLVVSVGGGGSTVRGLAI